MSLTARSILPRITALAAALCLSATATAALAVGSLLTADPGQDSGGADNAIYAFNPAGGSPVSFSNNSGSNSYNYLSFVLVSPTGVIYALDNDSPHTSVKLVDPTTGNSTVLSEGPSVAGTGPYPDATSGAFGGSVAMAWDAATGAILVPDPGNAAVTSGTTQLLSINPSTGNRTLISSNTHGTGPTMQAMAAIAVTPAGTIYVSDGFDGPGSIYSIDPSTGNRTLVASNSHGSGTSFSNGVPNGPSIPSMAWDPASSTLLVCDIGNGTDPSTTQLLRVDPTTGNRTLVASNAHGTGTAMNYLNGVYLSGSGKIYVSTNDGPNSQVFGIDPSTGNRTLISTGGPYSTVLEFLGLSIYGTQPSVTSVSSTVSNAAYKAGAVIPITVTFSAAVSVTGSPKIGLNSGGTATYASGSGTTTLTFSYTVGPTDNSAKLDCNSTSALTLNAGTISGPGDAFPALLTLPTPGGTNSLGANKALVIDTTAPAIAVSPPSVSTITSTSGSVTYTVTYSDANFSASTLAAGNITLNATGSASGSIAVTGSGTSRTVTLSSITGNGTLGITIAAGTASDTAGNTAAAATSSTFTVTKATATVNFGSLSTTYTASPQSPSVTTTPNGLSIGLTFNGGSTVPTAAGSYTVVATISDNTYTGTNTGTYVIGKAPLSVTGVTAGSRAYNGALSTTLSISGAALVGVQGTDSLALSASGATASFVAKTVGSGISVTIAGLTVTGSASSNYTLSQPTSVTASISTATLTVSGITAIGKTYDGSKTASLNTGSAALVGVYGTDAVSLDVSGASGMFVTKGVGPGITVNISGLALSGADKGNYSLTAPTTSASISSAGLTVTGLTVTPHVYDATTNAVVSTAGATLVGVAGGDAVSLVTTGLSATFDTKDVGSTKTVTVAGLTLAGGDSTNYTLTQPTLTGAVTAAPLTVTADNQTRAYGAANPTFTATITGFVGSETSAVLTGTASVTSAADPSSVPGSYPIVAALGTLASFDGDYSFSFVDGSLTVQSDPRVAWRVANFGTVNATGSAADDADPDGDGLDNLMEYALNSNPNVPSVSALPVVTMIGTPGSRTLVLSVSRNPSATDLTYTVESSTDLVNWTSAGLVTVTNTASSLVVQDSTTLGSSPRYLHLRISPTETTPAVGGIETALSGGSVPAPSPFYIGAPFETSQLWVSPATAVTASSVTYTGANWAAGAYTTVPSYIELLDGPLQGLQIDITGQTTDTLTLASASLSAYSPGMRFAIRHHATIASLFGSSSPSALVGASTFAAADDLEAYNETGQANAIYYDKTSGLGGAGWRLSTSVIIDQSGVVLSPFQGMLILRKSAPTSYAAFIGDAEESSQIIPLYLGNNQLVITSPVPETLSSLNLSTGDSTTGLVGDINVTAADEVQHWNGTILERLYYQTGGSGGSGWRSSTDASTDRGGQILKPGESIYIVKKHGGEALYTRPSSP